MTWWIVATGCVGPWPGASEGPLLDEARVSFMYPGPIGDHGWSFAHHEGLLEMTDALELKTYTFHELVDPADVSARIDEDTAEGYNLVYTVSSDYISPTQQAAVDHPDTYFVSCCGQVYSRNLTSYFGRMYQPIYLAGYLAASMSETRRIGVVAAKPFPEFVRHIDAFALGARAADPDAVIDVRWVNAFFDPVYEEQYTDEMIDLGADVILTQTDSTTPVVRVEERHAGGEAVFSIGYDNQTGCDAGPTSCLASAYWNWGPLYVRQVQSLLDGTWNPSDVSWQPMTNDSNSIVGLTTPSIAVPSEVSGQVSAERERLIDEPALPFVGPVYDNTGQLRIADGDALDDATMDRLCWFVEGVIDSSQAGDPPAVVPNTCFGDH